LTLNADGSALVYSTYLGGSSIERGLGITVDATGHAYVTGITGSRDFLTTLGAFKTSCGDEPPFCSDAFVTKLNADGTDLVYSTYLGGSGDDEARGIAVDATRRAYVTGMTGSRDFPTTPGAFQTSCGEQPPFSCRDAFVTKLNADGTDLVYSTYLGGIGPESVGGIAVDASGNTYVAGSTFAASSFPTTPGSFPTRQPGCQGQDCRSEPFVTKLNRSGTALVYSTYLTGFGDTSGLAVDALGHGYVTGIGVNFQTTPRAFQTTPRETTPPTNDAFVIKIADVEPPALFAGKVNGEGSIPVEGGLGTFAFNVQAKTTTGPVSGDLQYVNQASGATVQSVAFTGLVIVGKTATFDGTCTVNGTPCFFSVDVTDNGEPGRTDTFRISFSPGAVEGGTLQSGNIQIHQ
jgi:hypothetical protein